MFKRLLQQVLVWELLLFGGWWLHAQDIRMGPPIVEIMTTPGSTATFYLSLINQSDVDVQCNLLVKSMEITAAGMPYPVDSSARSLAPWVKINQSAEFILKGGENFRIRGSFLPPSGTAPGGYYGMVLCRTSEPKMIREPQAKLQTRLKLRFQFACVVMGIVQGGKLQAKIEPEGPTIFAGKRAGEKKEQNWYVELPIYNRGNIHVTLDGTVQLFSETGELVTKMGLSAGKGYLLPDQRRKFKAEGKGPLPDGIYVADLRVGQATINQFATETIPFYILNGNVLPGSPNKTDGATLEQTSQGFILSKSQLSIETAAGGHQFQTIQITNLTPRPQTITAAILPWDQNRAGDIIFPTVSKHRQELSTNIQLTPTEIQLAPKQKANFKIQVNVPKTAAGDYYDAIVFHRTGTTFTKVPTLLLTQSVLTSVRIKQTVQLKNELIDFQVQSIKDQGFQFQVVVKNVGNGSCFPEGRINVFDAQNAKIDETITFGADSFILAKNEREFVIEWGKLLAPGKYRAELTYLFAPNEKAIQKVIHFQVN
ncbi:hypothetical protein L0128_15695 [candidate division KSB1 bacterium]|nr:hypothetical protein [candidate division KSB1 bacterium]